jgi:ankyrin repeat protein
MRLDPQQLEYFGKISPEFLCLLAARLVEEGDCENLLTLAGVLPAKSMWTPSAVRPLFWITSEDASQRAVAREWSRAMGLEDAQAATVALYLLVRSLRGKVLDRWSLASIRAMLAAGADPCASVRSGDRSGKPAVRDARGASTNSNSALRSAIGEQLSNPDPDLAAVVLEMLEANLEQSRHGSPLVCLMDEICTRLRTGPDVVRSTVFQNLVEEWCRRACAGGERYAPVVERLREGAWMSSDLDCAVLLYPVAIEPGAPRPAATLWEQPEAEIGRLVRVGSLLYKPRGSGEGTAFDARVITGLVQQAAQAGIDKDAPISESGPTLLEMAAAHGSVHQVAALLEAGCDPRGRDGRSPAARYAADRAASSGIVALLEAAARKLDVMAIADRARAERAVGATRAAGSHAAST